jgi:hypothetical protein
MPSVFYKISFRAYLSFREALPVNLDITTCCKPLAYLANLFESYLLISGNINFMRFNVVSNENF